MAQMVLVIGESGTGKSTSMRNCDPATTAVVNPVGKLFPFNILLNASFPCRNDDIYVYFVLLAEPPAPSQCLVILLI